MSGNLQTFTSAGTFDGLLKIGFELSQTGVPVCQSPMSLGSEYSSYPHRNTKRSVKLSIIILGCYKYFFFGFVTVVRFLGTFAIRTSYSGILWIFLHINKISRHYSAANLHFNCVHYLQEEQTL
jgi:hypothetical protein